MRKNNIIRGIASLFFSQIIIKCFGLIYKLYLANKNGFGDMGNAIYNSGYQIYALLLTVSSIGVPNVISKFVAENIKNKNKIEEIMKNAFFLFFIIGVLASTMLAILSSSIATQLLNIPEARYSIIALSPAIFNVCIISVIRGYFNGIGRIETTAKSQSIEQILKTIFTFVFVELSYITTTANTTIMASWANFATTVATFGSFLYLFKKMKMGKLHGKIRKKILLSIFFMSIPVSLSAILAALNRNIDSITIVKYLTKYIEEDIAKKQYGNFSGKVDVIASVPISFVIAIATTIIPAVASQKGNIEELKKIVTKYIEYVSALIFPCSLFLFMFSDELLNLLFSSPNGSLLLRISAISLIFIAGEQIVNAVLHGIGKIYVPAISLFIGVVIKTLLNIYFLNLPPNQYWFAGIVGCVIATCICHFVAFAIVFFVLVKKIKIKLKILKFLLKPIIASCIMTMTLKYVYFLFKGIIIEKIAIILAGLVAMIIYIILIFVFGVIRIQVFGLQKFGNITKKCGKKKDFV